MNLIIHFRHRVRRILARCAPAFPEAQGLRFRVAAERLASNMEGVALDPSNRVLGISVKDYQAGERVLEEDIVHQLGHLAWCFERKAAGLDCDRGDAVETLTDVDSAAEFNRDRFALSELGAEIIATERARHLRVAYGLLGGERGKELDSFAYEVANSCEWYRNVVLANCSVAPHAVQPAFKKMVESFLTCSDYALRRYVELRLRLDAPLVIRGALNVAERPGFEFLRSLSCLGPG